MNTNKVNRRNGEQGQVLLAVIILLAIIVIGMLIVMNGVGVDVNLGTTARDCYEVVYASGLKDVVCH